MNGRNSDNTLIQNIWLGAGHSARGGMEKTYAWIYDQYMASQNQRTPRSFGSRAR